MAHALRTIGRSLVLNAHKFGVQRTAGVLAARHAHGAGPSLSPEEEDNYAVEYFQEPTLDAWQIRNGINKLHGKDNVPEPKIIIEVLKACRRLDDFSLTVRFLEAVQSKCGGRKNEIWPYILGEIKPTLDELGVSTPEEMGYDKPELACRDVMDIH